MPSTPRILIIKLIQAALLGAGLYMQYQTMEIFNHTTLMLACAAFGGYLAVVVGMILAALVQQPVPKRADILYNFMGACLFGAAGYFVLEYFYVDDSNTLSSLINKAKVAVSESERNTGMAKGAGCFIIAFTFLVDIIATLRE